MLLGLNCLLCAFFFYDNGLSTCISHTVKNLGLESMSLCQYNQGAKVAKILPVYELSTKCHSYSAVHDKLITLPHVGGGIVVTLACVGRRYSSLCVCVCVCVCHHKIGV